MINTLRRPNRISGFLDLGFKESSFPKGKKTPIKSGRRRGEWLRRFQFICGAPLPCIHIMNGAWKEEGFGNQASIFQGSILRPTPHVPSVLPCAVYFRGSGWSLPVPTPNKPTIRVSAKPALKIGRRLSWNISECEHRLQGMGCAKFCSKKETIQGSSAIGGNMGFGICVLLCWRTLPPQLEHHLPQ